MYTGKVILAAHRGDRKTCPENTMPAFEKALAFGVDMIETDIHMTKDGELIIMHDRNTKRTTGHDGLVDQMTFEKIKALDAGGWFSEEFKNTSVPSVQEFIEWIKDTQMLINWELKDYPSVVGDDFAFRAADKLVALIEENGLSARSMVNSFSDRVLEHIIQTHSHKFPVHGQGILHCQKTTDKATVPQTELYDWCCLYPEESGKQALDYPHNFAYCEKNNILPCVCVPDILEDYDRYIQLGCRMFTSNDIYKADTILRALGQR